MGERPKPNFLTEATVWVDEHIYKREYARERRLAGNQKEKFKSKRMDREGNDSWAEV